MQPIWSPSAERVKAANVTRFIECVNARKGLKLAGHADLYAWSIAHPGDFWCELARFADARIDWRDGPVIENPQAMPGARFFPAAKLNFAENLLRFSDQHPALVFRNERGARREISYRDLHEEVARIADGLKAAGVVAGDRVAGYLPNLPEAIIAMLATTSLGAIWSSCSPDFGINGVLDRFGQIAPKVLVTADGYFYAGKTIDSLGPIAQVLDKLPGVARVVVVGYVNARPDLSLLGNAAKLATHWSNFGQRGLALQFHQAPFDHPHLHSVFLGHHGRAQVHRARRGRHAASAPEGAPAAHRHQARRPRVLLHHLRLDDVELACERARHRRHVVLYDGSPFHPDPGALWRMAAQERINVFGTSAKFIAAMGKSQFEPISQADLSSLRAILSTGSPLLPEHFDYVYAARQDRRAARLDLRRHRHRLVLRARRARRCPCIAASFSAAASAWRSRSSTTKAARCAASAGELVCTAPFPSMPVGFWNDPDGRKYRAAYFERFPGVWHHGDYATLTEHDGLIIHGRSDAVLNPGGVRIGTAEIYAVVESFEEIVEALAVGQEWRGDVRVVLFVRLKAGATLDEELKKRIRDVDTHEHHAPARAREDHRRARHAAHALRQAHRARRARGDPRPPRKEHGCARQPAGARAFPQSRRARKLT